MSSVVDSVEASFKSLVAEKPYRSVTVKEICERAFISRHTFYMSFLDKRAVVTYLFKRDALTPATRALELLSGDEAKKLAPIIFERFYAGIYEQRDYYANLVKPMAGVDPTFELVVARSMCKQIDALVRRYAVGSGDDVDRRINHVAYYHAAAQAISLEKWICDDFDPTPEVMGAMQAQVTVPGLTWAARGEGGIA